VTVVKALGIEVVVGRYPIETYVSGLFCVFTSGIEQGRSHAGSARLRGNEQVIHDEDPVGNERVKAGIEGGESDQVCPFLGHEVNSQTVVGRHGIEEGVQLGLARKRSAVESEVALN
jgi:hypothetical protein